jgi:hypothetical protein
MNFQILELVNVIDSLNDREQYWLDLGFEYYDKTILNTSRISEGRSFSQEEKDKLSKSVILTNENYIVVGSFPKFVTAMKKLNMGYFTLIKHIVNSTTKNIDS